MFDNKNYEINIKEAALDKMQAHIEFLAYVNESAAERLLEDFRQGLESLCYNPESYARYHPQFKTQRELRCKLCAKRYRIVFEIIEKCVYVYDIQDCRQNIDKSLI